MKQVYTVTVYYDDGSQIDIGTFSTRANAMRIKETVERAATANQLPFVKEQFHMVQIWAVTLDVSNLAAFLPIPEAV